MRLRALLVSATFAIAATVGLATPAAACTGPVCDAVNAACFTATGRGCVK